MTLRLGLIIAGVVVILSIIVGVIKWNRDDAANDALDQVRKNNDKLGEAAEGGAIDYDACRRAGRLWNYERDRCGSVAADSRN